MINLISVYDESRPNGVRKNATEFLYELMKEREQEPEINISHRGLPTMAQHAAFMHSKPYRYWYLIVAPTVTNDLWVGYISATSNNEIGIVLQRYARGKGIGPMAIKQFMSTHVPNPASPGVRNGTWLANIAPANDRSLAVFKKLGFQKIQETYALPRLT